GERSVVSAIGQGRVRRVRVQQVRQGQVRRVPLRQVRQGQVRRVPLWQVRQGQVRWVLVEQERQDRALLGPSGLERPAVLASVEQSGTLAPLPARPVDVELEDEVQVSLSISYHSP